MYHDLLNTRQPKQRSQNFDLHTGFYTFYHDGGIVTGNVKRIGTDTVTVELPVMGKTVQIGTLSFLNSNPTKL